MLKDRRNATRRVINRFAQYVPEPGALPRSCLVTDISDGGARLFSDTPLPDSFVLHLKWNDRTTHRDCRVVWRLGGECGVAFADGRRS